MFISKSKILLVFILLVVALTLAACASGTSTTGTPPVGAPGAASPTVISGTVTSTVSLATVSKSLQDTANDLNTIAQQSDRLSPSDVRTILLQVSGVLSETGTLVGTVQPCESQLTGSQKQAEQNEAQRTNTVIQNNRIIVLQTAGLPTPTPTLAAGITASPTPYESPTASPTSMISPTATIATLTLTPMPTDTPTVTVTPTEVLASPTVILASPTPSPVVGTPGIGGPGVVETPIYGMTASPTPWPSPTLIATATPTP